MPDRRNALSRKQWAGRLNKAWDTHRGRSIDATFALGDQLVEAKRQLPHGEFQPMVETDLHFSTSAARMFKAIAECPTVRDHGHVLPTSWRTIYELTKLSAEEFADLLERKVIHPEMERADIAAALKSEKRAARESELGSKIAALPDARFGVILADPEWQFEVRSDAGLDRAAENHYPVSTLDVIKARPVARIAADDCVLFLWATVPMLTQALEVMAAWGFAYKSHAIWAKDRVGTGFWFRNKHELLLVGTRGAVVAPEMGSQPDSVVEEPVGAHSEKPTFFLELIEAWFPSTPKIELNRRGPPRPGWTAWGNEAEMEAAE